MAGLMVGYFCFGDDLSCVSLQLKGCLNSRIKINIFKLLNLDEVALKCLAGTLSPLLQSSICLRMSTTRVSMHVARSYVEMLCGFFE